MSMYGISLRANVYYFLCFSFRGKVLLFSVKHAGSTQARLKHAGSTQASIVCSRPRFRVDALFLRITRQKKCISTFCNIKHFVTNEHANLL